MIEWRTVDRDAELIAVGEVVGRFASGRMFLWKEHFLLRSVQGSPLPDPALQRAQLPRAEAARMATIKLGENRGRFQHSIPIRRQQCHHFAVEHLGKRISPRPPGVRLAPLRRGQPALPLVRTPHAHAGRRRCRLLRLAFHPLSPQHRDLHVLHHGASPPGSTSLARRRDGDNRQI
jgi:hypothetical protein